MASRCVFLESWWWDALVPGQWQQATVARDGHTVAALPYVYQQGPLGLKRLSLPPLTRWVGPWIEETDAKTTTRLARLKKLQSELIDSLPPYDHLQLCLDPEIDYWLPFFWAGFQIEARLTYRVAPAAPEALWAELDERIRRAVRKARRELEVVESNATRLIDAVRATYDRQSRVPPAEEARIECLVEQACQRGQGLSLAAVDRSGKLHAAAFVAWDHQRVYYVLGGGDPQLRTSGAASLLLLHCLELAGERGLEFDFAGSVVASIEHFFRAFGARPVTYLQISDASARYGVWRGLRSLWRAPGRGLPAADGGHRPGGLPGLRCIRRP